MAEETKASEAQQRRAELAESKRAQLDEELDEQRATNNELSTKESELSATVESLRMEIKSLEMSATVTRDNGAKTTGDLEAQLDKKLERERLLKSKCTLPAIQTHMGLRPTAACDSILASSRVLRRRWTRAPMRQSRRRASTLTCGETIGWIRAIDQVVLWYDS